MTAALECGELSAARSGRTLPSEKTLYPFYSRLGGPQGRSGRTENLVPHRDSIPDRPARSQSLYRLSYRAPVYIYIYIYIYIYTHTHVGLVVAGGWMNIEVRLNVTIFYHSIGYYGFTYTTDSKAFY